MTLHSLTPRAASLLAAGAALHVKEDQSIDLLVKAIESNNNAVDARLKALADLSMKTSEQAIALGEQIATLEQTFARGGHAGGTPAPKSWGEQFIAAPEIKSLIENGASRPRRFSASYGLKTTITSATGSGGDLVVPARDGLTPMPQRRLYVRNLLPTVNVNSGSVEYPRQTTRTNNAATVAEGALKPESALGFDLQTTSIRTIAHWIPASRQVLDDAPQLRGIVDSELIYGLKLKEDAQLLNGDGTGQNLLGLIPQATAYAAPITLSSPTILDQIGLALLQVTLADYEPDGIVMHPSDWMRIRLLKDSDGKYLFGEPGAVVPPVLFGLPVVATTSMTVDKFLIGAFSVAATLYDRWEARVEVSTEHDDFFVRNLVAILAEERIGLAVKRAGAMVYGDFGYVA
jgi:HK97 family phage major capsid protein